MAAGREIGRGGVAARRIGSGLALVVAAAAVGCGGDEPDGYDPAIRYPLRTDVLVIEAPPSPPTKPAPSGKLDEVLSRFGDLGGRVLYPTKLGESQKVGLRQALDAAFGTPAVPTGPNESPERLAAGSHLYRRHCAHCHGLTGDGRGPTGPWLYPQPRDFRQGAFKLAGPTGKPTAAALARVIRAGVPGTAMQPFDMIPQADVDAMVGYLVHLSLRGDAEFRTTAVMLGDEEIDVSPAEAVTAASGRAWKQWQAASEPPVPDVSADADADSIRRGHELFVAGCVGCHADYGRAEAYRYDVWGAAARVSDLTRGEHRWGKEPADLARRVRYGIPAAGMPANPAMSDAQVRDVVAFLRELPTPPRLPADVRDRVYGKQSAAVE